jgi:outer membrane receptor for ferrienterochelin and colicins
MVNARVGRALTSRVDLWANGEYRSSRARRVTAATNAAWNALGDFKAYGLMHLGANVRLYRGLSTRIAVNNVFNTDFLRFGSYTSNNQVVYTSLYNNHQEGRRIWLQTSLDF